LGSVGLIKIDVEGHEYEAISGAVQVISKNRPVILFEQHSNEFNTFDDSSKKSTRTIELLKSLNYKKFAVIEYSPQKEEGFRPWFYPKLLRSLFRIFSIFLFQPTIKISIKDYLLPKKYPIIIALP
jgi:hypothetical protein